MEVVKGFRKVQDENRIQQFLTQMQSVEVLTLDVLSAELAGRIFADLERTGRTIGRIDPMIRRHRSATWPDPRDRKHRPLSTHSGPWL